MVSSHILPELADICNKVGIIDRGVMSVNATVSDVMKQVRQRIVLHIEVDSRSRCGGQTTRRPRARRTMSPSRTDAFWSR
jgi:ABC-2 type transport system ATP-binding protein